MASLHRIASFDTTPRSCSNPAYCTNRLTRHSSLPNLFLCCQPGELSMKAPGSRLSPASLKLARRCFPSLCFKHPSCRASLSSHSFDELPHNFCIPAAVDACGLFSGLPATELCDGRSSHCFQTSPRKEALVALGKQSLDMEKSIVYTELKESMWKFEPPPRFLKPSYIEGTPCPAIHTHMHTHIHETPKPIKNPDLCMDQSRRNHDVKGRPLSLRMLKRKLSQETPPIAHNMQPCGLSFRSKQLNKKCAPWAESNHVPKPQDFLDPHDSVASAFTSLLYIMNSLQQYTQSLRMQSWRLIVESDQSSHENLMGRACTEMLDSLLWLFQQVFCCTPRLMLLTMVLLADFTLHSMSRHVAFPVMPLGQPPTSTTFPGNIRKLPIRDTACTDAHIIHHHGPEEARKVRIAPSKSRGEHSEHSHSGESGNGGHTRTRYGGRDAKESRELQIKTTADGSAVVNGDLASSSSLLHGVNEKPSEYLSRLKELDLDVPMKHVLVAPVRAPALEADNYPCFDRTDLAYQHAITMDPSNPLLLANYAQFLHLVRRDYGRAEELYKKAVSVEAEVDGDVMGRFASFLWVAKGDVAEADRAFKAATVADPTNAFHAGNYAHFLWNSSASQA